MLRGFLHIVLFFFECVQVGPEFGDLFADLFDSKMVDVEGLSAFGKDLLLLFALGLAFVGFVLFGSSEVATVVEGHVGNGLLLLVFFGLSLFFFFGFLLFSFLSFADGLLLFLFCSFLHFYGALCFTFFDSKSEGFEIFFVLLALFEVGVDQTLELDQVLLMTFFVDIVEVNSFSIGDGELRNVQGWGLWGFSSFLFRFWFWLWFGFWLWFFFNLFFNFFNLFDFFYYLLLVIRFDVRHVGWFCCRQTQRKETNQI